MIWIYQLLTDNGAKRWLDFMQKLVLNYYEFQIRNSGNIRSILKWFIMVIMQDFVKLIIHFIHKFSDIVLHIVIFKMNFIINLNNIYPNYYLMLDYIEIFEDSKINKNLNKHCKWCMVGNTSYKISNSFLVGDHTCV